MSLAIRTRSPWLLVAALAVCTAGCGRQAAPPTAADDELLAELSTESVADAPAQDDSEPVARPVQRPIVVRSAKSSRPAQDVLRKPKGERLELRLNRGDRFPLMKTVEQTLMQKSETHPAFAKTRLELSLAITVQDVQPDAVLLGIVYSRVVSAHDISGRRLRFDSAAQQDSVPWDAIPYAGMVGNGFSFWLGRDNRIRELVGYREFLERCVERVPLERRQSLLAELSGRFGDDGVANFVDDSIGLLPYDSSVDTEARTLVMPGDVWTRERRLMQPVPVHLTSTYTLTSINERTAEIEIAGRIASSEAVNSNGPGRVRISGGRSEGTCIVDRATGLPLEVSVTRTMSLRVATEEGVEVQQDKSIVTTIRAFPEFRGERQPAAAPKPAAIRRVSEVQEAGGTVANPTESGEDTGRAIQAVYP
ncbi:MAG: DUF6263 family protein [Planctomyces sp.]